MPPAHPVNYEVEFPDRQLNRLSSFFRIFTAIPILVVFTAIGGMAVVTDATDTTTVVASSSAFLFFPPLLMLLFREKYPRWWYDFNVELLRFQNRVGVYAGAHGRPLPLHRRTAERPPRVPGARTGSTAGCRS